MRIDERANHDPVSSDLQLLAMKRMRSRGRDVAIRIHAAIHGSSVSSRYA